MRPSSKYFIWCILLCCHPLVAESQSGDTVDFEDPKDESDRSLGPDLKAYPEDESCTAGQLWFEEGTQIYKTPSILHELDRSLTRSGCYPVIDTLDKSTFLIEDSFETLAWVSRGDSSGHFESQVDDSEELARAGKLKLNYIKPFKGVITRSTAMQVESNEARAAEGIAIVSGTECYVQASNDTRSHFYVQIGMRKGWISASDLSALDGASKPWRRRSVSEEDSSKKPLPLSGEDTQDGKVESGQPRFTSDSKLKVGSELGFHLGPELESSSFSSDAQGHPEPGFQSQSLSGGLLQLWSERFAAKLTLFSDLAFSFNAHNSQTGSDLVATTVLRLHMLLLQQHAPQLSAGLGIGLKINAQIPIVESSPYERYPLNVGGAIGPVFHLRSFRKQKLNLRFRGGLYLGAAGLLPNPGLKYDSDASEIGPVTPVRDDVQTADGNSNTSEGDVLKGYALNIHPQLLVNIELLVSKAIGDRLTFSFGPRFTMKRIWILGPGLRSISAYRSAHSEGFKLSLVGGLTF